MFQPEKLIIQRRLGADQLLVLAHGAGAPMDSPFMESLSHELLKLGITVIRFEFPYMQERRDKGKKRPPNRMPELLEYWYQVIDWVESEFSLPVFIGGKSMGGRAASMAVGQKAAVIRGCLCYGYPFHPKGKPDTLRVEHLTEIQLPVHIVQGTRDSFGKPEEVVGYGLAQKVSVDWLDTGDHDFIPLKKTRMTQHDLIMHAALVSKRFMNRVCK